jgi:hypothetical protein
VFTSVARLRALAAAGRVRYAFDSGGCGSHTPPTDPDCSAPVRWAQAHGRDVSLQAGMPRPGMLWLLPVASFTAARTHVRPVPAEGKRGGLARSHGPGRGGPAAHHG